MSLDTLSNILLWVGWPLAIASVVLAFVSFANPQNKRLERFADRWFLVMIVVAVAMFILALVTILGD